MSERQHISLHKLQSIIKTRLEDAMPLPVWVTAEVSEIKVNYSGHCYLELVEKGGENQVPKARASAVIWRSQYGLIGSYFRSATGGDLAQGMKVLLKVAVNYHELYGMSLVVSDIDPLYTLGDMEHQRQQTIAKLQQEGVYDMNRMLELPHLIQRIAVVSSRNAAGYQDFINELEASGYAFSITLFDAFMQGNAAEESIVDALEGVAEAMDKFDVVVLIRGGGSQSDLAVFNSYRLCSHIAQFPLPVVAGIGHDKDQSVADMVAAVSLKTPTAVATYLVAELADFDGWLDGLRAEIIGAGMDNLKEQKQRLQATAYSFSKTASTFIHELHMRLGWLSSETIRLNEGITMQQSNRVHALQRALLDDVAILFSRERVRLDSIDKIVQSREPAHILSMGFAVVRSGGVVVRDGAGLNVGDRLDITLSKGRLSAKVEKKELKKNIK